MNSKKGIALLLGTLILSLCVYSYLFCSVNSEYPQSKKLVYAESEVFQSQGVDCQIISSRFVETADIVSNEELYADLSKNFSENVEDYKLILLTVQISNQTSEEKEIDLTTFHLESENFSTQFFYPLVLYYNDNSGMMLKLSAGESISYILPAPIHRVAFSETEWEDFNKREFQLVTALYPSKKIVKLVL